jgi:tetratricopeptide (TPR) repeat protein
MQEAITAFEIAVTQSPLFADAHERLAQLYIKQKAMDKAAEHQDRAFNARQQIAAYKAGGPLAEETSDGESSLSEAASLGDWGELEEQGDLPPDAIVVVSGLPRSGTSMMMQMLAAGGLPVLTDNVRQADESNPRGYYELEQAKQVGKSADWLKDASGKAVKIIAQLLPHLPPDRPYRILFMDRPLGEITASQSAMLARLGRQGATLSDKQLADTYRKQIAAVRRVLAAYPDRVSVLSINYHVALADPAVIAKRVNAFLGGHLNEAAMVAAVEPSLRHQRVESVTG